VRYEQLVVAQGFDYKESDRKQFLEIFKKHHFHRPKIVGVIITLPSKDSNGKIIAGTGGRKDFFFYINNKDIEKFSIWRFNYNFRWYEDIYYNHEEDIYPKKFKDKYKPRW